MDRRWRHFVEGSIHAIADFEILFERLEVDVRSLFLDRLIENEVDVADDGGGVCLGFGVGGVEILGGSVKLAEDVIHRASFTSVALVDLGFHEIVGSDDDDDFAAEGEPEVLDGLRVQGIYEGQVKALAVEVDGKGTVEAGSSRRNEREQGIRRSPVP